MTGSKQLKHYFSKHTFTGIRAKVLITALIVISILLISYAEGLRAPFLVIDDLDLVNIPQIRSEMSFALLKTIFTPGYHIDFYPLRDLSYWVDVNVFHASSTGEDGLVFRLQNFLWHSISLVGIAMLLIKLGASVGVALSASALWSLNPYHAESLMWISARKDVMAMALGIWSLYFTFDAFKKLNCRQSGGLLAFIFSIFLFICSLLSKTTFVLVPGIVLILVAFIELKQKRTIYKWVCFIAPYLAVALICAYLQREQYTKFNDMRFYYESLYRVQGQLVALGKGLAGFFWSGVNLVDVENWGEWSKGQFTYLILGSLYVLAIIFLIFKTLTQRSVSNFTVVIGLAIVIATYLPVSGLIFPHRNFYSVRYYEPMLLVLWVFFALKAPKFFLSKKLVLLTSLYLLTLGIHESRHWVDDVAPLLKTFYSRPERISVQRLLVNAIENKMRLSNSSENWLGMYSELKSNVRKNCFRNFSEADLRNGHECLGYWRSISHDKNFNVLSNESVFNLERTAAMLNPFKSLESLQSAQFNRSLSKNFSTEKINKLESQGFEPKIVKFEVNERARMRLIFLLCQEGSYEEAKAQIAYFFQNGLLDNKSFINHDWLEMVAESKNQICIDMYK